MFEAQLKRTRRRKHGHPERSRGIPPRFLNSIATGWKALPRRLRFAMLFVAISLAEDGRHLLSALLSRRIFSTSAPFYCTGLSLPAWLRHVGPNRCAFVALVLPVNAKQAPSGR